MSTEATEIWMTKERFSELILDYLDNHIDAVLEELNYDFEDGTNELTVEYVEEVLSLAHRNYVSKSWEKLRHA